MRVLDLIATAQKAGFSLDEIRTLLPPDLEQWQHGPPASISSRQEKPVSRLPSTSRRPSESRVLRSPQ